MIVVDTNIVAYFLVEGPRTSEAEAVWHRDPEWTAPSLWRSEFRNVLVRYLRQGGMTLPVALRLMEEAEELFEGREYRMNSPEVLNAAVASGCTAYDCEFAVLARELGVPLVTTDGELLKAFPGMAVSPERFAAR